MPVASQIDTPWMKVAEAAEYTRRSKTIIFAALRSGELRGNQRKSAGTWLIHRDDLDAWLRGDVADVEVPKVSRRRTA